MVVSGEIDMMSADDFLTTALAIIDRTREVVLDVADLTYVDSAAVRAIVRLGIEARHGVLLHSPHPNVMRMLDMIDVEHLAGILRVEG